MRHPKSESAQRQLRVALEKGWLHYYNQLLFDQGLITESERNRMTIKIEERKSPMGG